MFNDDLAHVFVMSCLVGGSDMQCLLMVVQLGFPVCLCKPCCADLHAGAISCCIGYRGVACACPHEEN